MSHSCPLCNLKTKTFIIVGYYTRNTLYEVEVKRLIESLERFNIPYYVEAIDSLGDWWKNTGYKPTFIKGMLRKFPKVNIVYVDCDAEFLAYPVLFDDLATLIRYSIAIYLFDRSCYKNSKGGFEVLSGTIFLRNDEEAFRLVERWEEECKKNIGVWDQKSLEKVLAGNFDTLPGEYCKIFDRMEWITEPVIIHYQASRKVRKNKGKLNV